MPRRYGPRARDANHGALMTIDPALALCARVIQQALHDMRSSRPDVREDAVQFLTDEVRLAWWSDILGINSDALQRQVQAVLRDGR